MSAKRTVTVSEKDMKSAFMLWCDRVKADPDDFGSRGTSEEFGDACAPFFMDIIDEVQHAGKGEK